MPLDFEDSLNSDSVNLIVGTDEAGRGCLLGPVFAAAVILPKGYKSSLINDSKKLSAKKREEAYQEIINNALAYAITSIDPETIDKINILNASRLAMLNAIKELQHPYDLVITDYMNIPDLDKEVIALAHGDALSINVAAASILAKVSRDAWCLEADKQYPQYNIALNKGYGTKDHLEALEKYGPVRGLHRLSYGPVKKYLIQKINLF